MPKSFWMVNIINLAPARLAERQGTAVLFVRILPLWPVAPVQDQAKIGARAAWASVEAGSARHSMISK